MLGSPREEKFEFVGGSLLCDGSEVVEEGFVAVFEPAVLELMGRWPFHERSVIVPLWRGEDVIAIGFAAFDLPGASESAEDLYLAFACLNMAVGSRRRTGVRR